MINKKFNIFEMSFQIAIILNELQTRHFCKQAANKKLLTA